jgi:hypothetical protein
MQTVSEFPYFEVQFNKEGGIHDEDEVVQILSFLRGSNLTDLCVISHGWNNDMDEARTLYKNFLRKSALKLNKRDCQGLNNASLRL